MTVQPPDPPRIRISDADRERAAARLHVALSEGRITVSELDERLAVVYAARYDADLRPPLADLPGADQPGVGQVPLPSTPSGPPVLLRTGIASLRRTGPWAVPARLRVVSTMGSVLLDFCDAEIAHPVVEIELDLGMGSARLLVPDSATANIDDLVSAMGTLRCKVPSLPRPGATHFVVHGRTGMGAVTIRRRYRLGGHRF